MKAEVKCSKHVVYDIGNIQCQNKLFPNPFLCPPPFMLAVVFSYCKAWIWNTWHANSGKQRPNALETLTKNINESINFVGTHWLPISTKGP